MKSAIKNSDAISFMYEEVAKEEVERGEMCYLDIEDFSITRPYSSYIQVIACLRIG